MAPPKKPKTGLIVGVVIAVLVVAGGTWVLWRSPQTLAGTPVAAAPASTTSTRAPATTVTRPVSCVYTPTPDQPAVKSVSGVPGNAIEVPTSGEVKVTLTTNLGDIPLVLDRAGAPCSVHSFLFLIGQKYHDGVPCHRLTMSSSLSVLQCGDPSGTSTGGPGYQFDDRPPTRLKQVSPGVVNYPKATVAMANAGRGTNGSQFFLVYRDSQIPPDYPVLGVYAPSAQSIIDKVVSGGVDPASSPVPEEGRPKTAVTIQRATAEG